MALRSILLFGTSGLRDLISPRPIRSSASPSFLNHYLFSWRRRYLIKRSGFKALLPVSRLGALIFRSVKRQLTRKAMAFFLFRLYFFRACADRKACWQRGSCAWRLQNLANRSGTLKKSEMSGNLLWWIITSSFQKIVEKHVGTQSFSILSRTQRLVLPDNNVLLVFLSTSCTPVMLCRWSLSCGAAPRTG